MHPSKLRVGLKFPIIKLNLVVLTLSTSHPLDTNPPKANHGSVMIHMQKRYLTILLTQQKKHLTSQRNPLNTVPVQYMQVGIFYYNVVFCQGTHTCCSLLHKPQDLHHIQSLLLKVRLHRHEGTAGITAIERYLYSVLTVYGEVQSWQYPCIYRIIYIQYFTK